MERMEKTENLGLSIGKESVNKVEEIRSCLERAGTSEWIDDEVEIVGVNEGLVLRNMSKIEELDALGEDFKSKVADYALELLDLREREALTPGKENQLLLGDIKGYRDQINGLKEKRKLAEAMLTNSNWTDDPDKNVAFLRAVSISDARELYGKKMSMRDLIQEIRNKLN